MDRWQRRPPISGMPIEEMKRRVADGIARRRQTGELPPETDKVIALVPKGPTLTPQHRRVLIRAAELAIYSLCNNEPLDYVHAALAIDAVRRQAGYKSRFMKAFLEGVAAQASEIADEPFEVLDRLARTWLDKHLTPSGKLISIPKGGTHGNGKDEPHD